MLAPLWSLWRDNPWRAVAWFARLRPGPYAAPPLLGDRVSVQISMSGRARPRGGSCIDSPGFGSGLRESHSVQDRCASLRQLYRPPTLWASDSYGPDPPGFGLSWLKNLDHEGPFALVTDKPAFDHPTSSLTCSVELAQTQLRYSC